MNVPTENIKYFNLNFAHGPYPHLQAGASAISVPLNPIKNTSPRGMASTDFGHSSDYSSGSDDPDRPSGVTNSLLQLQDAYATGPDSVVDTTLQTKNR